ncbi:MAG: DUF488 domain-containing protein [Acidimicrobiia bacterium]|nr:DUF488 domain-containing protein [Acidimicrobiia bacterium]
MTPVGDVTIYTIGHGDQSFGELEQRIAPHRIQAIVDVRSIPYSRHAPEFTKAELEAIAAEAGLGYRWLGDHLGGRPTDPELLTDGVPDMDKVVASSHFRAGIEELLGVAQTSRVVVLCSELDPRHCHRTTWIAQKLEDAGAHVWHIDADGAADRHQPNLGL